MKAVSKLLGLFSSHVVTHAPKKGDIRSCAKYACSIANRSYFGKSQKIGGAK